MLRLPKSTLADSVSERAHVRCLVAAPDKTLGGIIPPEGPAWQAILMRQLRKIRIRAARVGQRRSMKASREGHAVEVIGSLPLPTDRATPDNGSSHAAAKAHRNRAIQVARAPVAITGRVHPPSVPRGVDLMSPNQAAPRGP